MDFSNQRFIDIGQSIFIEWLKPVTGLKNGTEEERREVFKLAAQFAFEAAEEFAEVFRDQE